MKSPMIVRSRHNPALDLYTIGFGFFLFASPWLFAYAGEDARVDGWVLGAAIAGISIAASIAFAKWEEWLNLLLAAWLIASPWIFGFAHTRAMHVSIAIGTMVAFIAALELWLAYYEPNYISCGRQHISGATSSDGLQSDRFQP